jgi:cell division septation protein DedD
VTRPARVIRGAVTMALASALAAIGASLFAPIAEGARKPSPTPTPSATSVAVAQHRIAITLGSLEPKVVRPHDVVTITGTIVNTSGAPLTSVSVTLRGSSRRINTRYDLARNADPALILGSTILNTRQTIGALAPGESATWRISVPVERLELPSSTEDFGAYPIAIDARSTIDDAVLTSRLPTSLMWMPEGAQFVPTQISWLMPLVGGVHRGNGNVFLDDQLASDLATSGRLERLVELATAARVPITYFIDPALIDDATVMSGVTPAAATVGEVSPNASATAKPSTAKPTTTKSPAAKSTAKPSSAKPSATKAEPSATAPPAVVPYRVLTDPRGSSQAARNGVGSDAATGWLAALHSLIAAPAASVVGLPYGDPDVVAVERAGLDKEIAIARSTGQSTLTADLGVGSLPDVSWPVDGVLNESTLEALASDLVDTVVLDDRELPARDVNAVTGARANLQTAAGTVKAVLTDSAVSSLLNSPAATPGGTRVTEQRFLAETMLITGQRPGTGSSVVVAPPRSWDPADGFAATLIADSAAVPWLKGAGLAQVAAQPSDSVPRSSLVYPDAARAAEIPGSDLAPIAALRGDLAAFSAILGSSTTETFINTLSIAILRAESSTLRGRPEISQRIRQDVQTFLDLQTARVYIIKPGLITLTSRKQKIPITVVNNLPDPVTVQIRVSAVNSARLTVTPQEPFTVPGNQSRREVLVEVEATTGGRFDVTAQLWTPETTPRPYGAAVPFILNSTAYGAVALAIAAGAAGLVFLLSAVRLIRRFVRGRRARRSGTTPDTGEDDEALADQSDPAEPANSPLTP